MISFVQHGTGAHSEIFHPVIVAQHTGQYGRIAVTAAILYSCSERNAAADAQAADEAAGTSDSADSYQLFTLDSYATSMSEIQKLISTNAAEPVWSDIDGQYYVQYENNGITYKIWVEDAASLEEKLKVLQENQLAGGSFWKLGLELPSIWDTIIKYIN